MSVDPIDSIVGAHRDRMLDLELAECRNKKQQRLANEAMESLRELLWNRKYFIADYNNQGCDVRDIARIESDNQGLFAEAQANNQKLLDELAEQKAELIRSREINEQRFKEQLKHEQHKQQERWKHSS